MPRKRSGPRSGSASPPAELVVLRASPPTERADAARNRAAVLAAAAQLFRRHGVEGVSLDAIAAQAGVGKGTVFRRFGDKAGLAVALLDERERDLQAAVLSGAPPLGPGPADRPAAPAARLRAFVSAYLDYVLDHLDLVRMSETGSAGARYRIGAYRFWHRHVALLLAELPRAAGPDPDALTPDPDALAHVLLAAVGAEHLRAVLAELGPDRLRRATLALVDAVTGD